MNAEDFRFDVSEGFGDESAEVIRAQQDAYAWIEWRRAQRKLDEQAARQTP
ncbi:MAG TPA: hypothetical protein VGG75_06280 [Trebonia sp.]|jgi:hypothetical protein